MNTALRLLFAALLLVTPLAAADKAADGKGKYSKLKAADKKEREIIENMEGIKIDGVEILDLTASEALYYLRVKVVGEEGGGIINTVIRGAEKGRKKATIKKESVSFARAVDEICVQTGWQWAIDFNEISGTPILVLTNNNDQQDVGPQSATRSESRSGGGNKPKFESKDRPR